MSDIADKVLSRIRHELGDVLLANEIADSLRIAGITPPIKDAITAVKEKRFDIREYAFKLVHTDFNEILQNLTKATAGFFATYPLYVLMHEQMHSAASKILGYDVNYLGVNKGFPAFGNLAAKLLPWIDINVSERWSGYLGASQYYSAGIKWHDAIIWLAPYLLSIPGLYALNKSISKKSSFLIGACSAFALYPAYVATFGYSGKSDLGIIAKKITDNPDYNALIGLAIAGGFVYCSKKINRLGKWVKKKLVKEKNLESRLTGKQKAVRLGLAAGIASALFGLLAWYAKPNAPKEMMTPQLEKRLILADSEINCRYGLGDTLEAYFQCKELWNKYIQDTKHHKIRNRFTNTAYQTGSALVAKEMISEAQVLADFPGLDADSLRDRVISQCSTQGKHRQAFDLLAETYNERISAPKENTTKYSIIALASEFFMAEKDHQISLDMALPKIPENDKAEFLEYVQRLKRPIRKDRERK